MIQEKLLNIRFFKKLYQKFIFIDLKKKKKTEDSSICDNEAS